MGKVPQNHSQHEGSLSLFLTTHAQTLYLPSTGTTDSCGLGSMSYIKLQIWVYGFGSNLFCVFC